MTQNIKLEVMKLPNLDGLPLPSYATIDSAGMDLFSTIDYTLKPSERKAIPTGIAIAIPPGYEAQIRPRSGLALKYGISIPNSPGTIDADYRGEVCVILINLSQEDFVIKRGTRIAQMIITSHFKASWEIVEELGKTERGSGGFGSTGDDDVRKVG